MRKSTPHEPVTSRENAAFKRLRGLADPKERKRERLFLVEGVKMVEEALGGGADVRQVVAAPSLTQHHGKGVLKQAEQRGVEVLWLSERLLDAVAESKTPQPVLAVVAMPEHGQEELLGHPAGLIVLCHQLQDPGNLGSIVRTSEAAGAAGVAVSGNTVDAYNPKTVRASMGSVLRLPVVPVAETASFITRCREKGYQTAALALSGDRTVFDLDLTGPTLVVLGQEGSGLPDAVLRAAGLRVRIPMAGSIDSLNVAASAAVFLYEALRQRQCGSGE